MAEKNPGTRTPMEESQRSQSESGGTRRPDQERNQGKYSSGGAQPGSGQSTAAGQRPSTSSASRMDDDEDDRGTTMNAPNDRSESSKGFDERNRNTGRSPQPSSQPQKKDDAGGCGCGS